MHIKTKCCAFLLANKNHSYIPFKRIIIKYITGFDLLKNRGQDYFFFCIRFNLETDYKTTLLDKINSKGQGKKKRIFVEINDETDGLDSKEFLSLTKLGDNFVCIVQL
jgi:hypothetical protein